MYKHATLRSVLACSLIVAIFNTMAVPEALAALRDLFAPSITGQAAAEAISRETRARVESRAGNSVDTGSGAFVLESGVVNLTGGRPLDFNISYNSLLTHARGSMGFGWSHNYEAFLEGNPSGTVTVYWNKNQKNSFSFVSANNPYRPEDEAVQYERLLRQTDGTWMLTLLDGTIYEFGANGELRRIGNKVGQYLQMERTKGLLTSIREPISGRTLSLEYNPEGLLQSIEDQLDRIFFFSYDSSQRLTAVFSPTVLGPIEGEGFAPKSIPDNNSAGLTHTIAISRTNPVGLVRLETASISHARVSDLTVSLTSPRGTRVVLRDRVAQSSGSLDLAGYVVDAFLGENPQGSWNVMIVDSAAGVVGALNGWRLRFTDETHPTRYQYDTDRVSTEPSGPSPIAAPSNLTAYRGRNDEKLDFMVTGSSSNSIWGTDVYTDDSSLAKAAVHAGLLSAEETGIITATILPGQASYQASTRNGVASGSFGVWSGSYALSRYEPPVTALDSSRITRSTGPDGEQLFANGYDSAGRVIEQDDGVATNKNAMFKYEELSGNTRTTYWNRLGDPSVFEHDGKYRLLSRTNPLGHRISYAYNATGDLIRSTDALGRTTIFNYDVQGNLITHVDPSGSVTTFEYVDGNVVKIRDALGKETTFSYDPNHNLKQVRDALGHEDDKSYTGTSQLGGNLMAGRGGITYGYTVGMPASATHPAESGTARMEYDSIGRLTQAIDLDGFVTRTAYSLTGQVASTTDAQGNSVTSEYDRRDRLVRKVDRNGNATRFTYDNNDNLIVTTDALGQVARNEYDGEDRLVRTIDAKGNASSITYDAAGRVIAEINPLGNTVTHVYDAAGNETATHDARGIKTRETVYDANDRPTLSRDAMGHTTKARYDAVGRLTLVADALDRQFNHQYDALDRPESVLDPLDRASSQTYWPDDFVRTIKNPRDFETEFRYDPARRLERVTTAGNRITRLQYNKRDLVTRVTKPSGRIHDFTYDAAGRLTRLAVTGPGLIVPVIEYEYDRNGNLITVSRRAFSDIQPVPRLRRTYDALDRLKSYTDGDGNRLEYSYDAAGNLALMVYPDGKTVRYTYDDANRLATITDWAGRVTRYIYDANSLPLRVELPNGASRGFEYDTAGRMIRRQDVDGQGQMIAGYKYSYDASGRVTAEATETPTPAYTPPGVTMTYDSDNRLATFNGQPVTSDDDGRMTRGPLGSSFRDYGYDHKSNLLSAGDVSYSYDEEDRLIAINADGQETRLVVSPSGDLSQVMQKTSRGGITTQYVYGVGLVYEVTGSQVKVYHYDQRGSTVAFTGNDGRVQGTVAYGPFGEVVQRTGEADSLFLYVGLFGVITDPQGLNCMRFRWYSPQIKRFLNPDAQYGDIARPGSLNRYTYAANDPISRIDPGGEFWNIIGGALIGGVAGVAIKMVSDAISGKKIDFNSGDYWAEIGGSFASGAATGACVGSGVGIAAGALCGAAGSSLGYLTTQGLKGDPVDPGQLAAEAAVGAAAGALGAGAGRFLRFGPRISVGNRFAHFRHGYRASNATNFKLGLLARDKAVMASDEYLVAHLLPKTSLRNLIGTGPGREMLKAAARRAFTPTFGALAGGSLAVRIGGRLGINQLFNPQTNSAGRGDRPEDNPDRELAGQKKLSSGEKGKYGEFIHWQLYINALTQAARPIPNNPNNVLAAF